MARGGATIEECGEAEARGLNSGATAEKGGSEGEVLDGAEGTDETKGGNSGATGGIGMTMDGALPGAGDTITGRWEEVTSGDE
jgi:hypothetical protein